MAVSIPLPRLLDGDGHERARLQPVRLALTLDLTPLSTAEMVLPAGEANVSAGDMVELFHPHGSAGVFRAAMVSRDYVSGEQTIRLEHGLVTLGDAVVPGWHVFIGWDANDPQLTITGYMACCQRWLRSTGWSPATLEIDGPGGRVMAVLPAGLVVPVIMLTDSGWRVEVSQQLLDHAESMTGSWDGVTMTGLIRSGYLTACTPISNATVRMPAQCSGYWRPESSQTAICRIPAGAQVTVHARCEDSAYLAVEYRGDNGRPVYCFVAASALTLPESAIIGSAVGRIESQFAQVANALLEAAHSPDPGWVFGESDFSQSFGYEIENMNLLDAILSLPQRLSEPYQWAFDQTVRPWRLHLRRLEGRCQAELRRSRNLSALEISVDTAGMVNCVLPLGQNGLTVAEVNGGDPFVTLDGGGSRHTEMVLHTTETDARRLYETAMAYLSRHSQASVSVTVSALDLSQLTGEPMDALTLGKRCRVPLPEHGLTVEEYITRLAWSDVYGAPEQVTVTLANCPETASDMLAKLMRK